MRTKSKEKLNRIIEFVDEYYDKYGMRPTLDEIASGASMSRTMVHSYIKELDAMGKLKYSRREIVTPKRAKRSVKLHDAPLVGAVACGEPIFAEENIEEVISLPERFTGKGEFFFLRAKGDSMINAGINQGDLVLIRKQSTAEQGQIVVALCEDSEATLKRFYKENDKIILRPENDSMEDIIVSDCQIQGVAVKVIKDL